MKKLKEELKYGKKGITLIALVITIVNTLNGANEAEIIEGITVKTSEQLKNLADTLGETFKKDTNTINNGYPILDWQ